MSILKVHNLVKKYGDQYALNGINFSIDKGEIVGFLGPNGAGKSTTMKIIAGILPADQGAVYINDVLADPSRVSLKNKIAYLPEQNPLYTELYVQEALRFNASLHQIPNPTARIKEAIHVCGLEKEKHKKIQELSKGFRQRVGLAISLLHQPDLYILDEATTGLDPNQLIEIRDLLKTIGKDHAILISTHIMQEVESLCQRCIVINKGVIIADDSMLTLKQKSAGKNIVIVRFADPIKKEVVQSQWDHIVQLDNHTYSISATDPLLSQSVYKWAQKNNLVLDELRKEDYKIEDVFQTLTNK